MAARLAGLGPRGGLDAYWRETDARIARADSDSTCWLQRMQAVPKDPEAGSVCTEELYKIWSPVVADLQKIPARPEASVYKANLEKLTASRFEYFVKANYTPKKCVEFQLKVADLKARGMSEKGISEVTRQDQELLLHHQQDLAKQEALRVQLSQEVASERQRRAR